MVIGYTYLGHIVERHAANKVLDDPSSENTLKEVMHTVSSGFPLYGLPVSVVVIIVVVCLALLVAWNLVGKGQGSHSGREEVRRAYRRRLAQEMAKEDAEKIRRGEKPRRRWMQW